MKKVKVIEKIDAIEDAIEITEDMEACELITTDKCKQKIIKDGDKLYLVTDIKDIFEETQEYSKMQAKKLLEVGSYLLESRNRFTGEKSYINISNKEVVELDKEIERITKIQKEEVDKDGK